MFGVELVFPPPPSSAAAIVTALRILAGADLRLRPLKILKFCLRGLLGAIQSPSHHAPRERDVARLPPQALALLHGSRTASAARCLCTSRVSQVIPIVTQI